MLKNSVKSCSLNWLIIIPFVIFGLLFLSGFIKYKETKKSNVAVYQESKEERYLVNIYFKKDISEDQIVELKEQIDEEFSPQSIKYVSKNDAYENYKSLNKDNELLVEMSSPDTFPDSLEIVVKNKSEGESIKTSLTSNSIVDLVSVSSGK